MHIIKKVKKPVYTASILFSVLYSRKLGGNLNKLLKSAHNIAEGNLNMEAIAINTNDEVSKLTDSFNSMTETLRLIIGNIIETSENVAKYAETLKVGTEQGSKAITQIAESISQVSQGGCRTVRKL